MGNLFMIAKHPILWACFMALTLSVSGWGQIFAGEFDVDFEEEEKTALQLNDFAQPVNRVINNFNRWFYKNLARPAAKGYVKVIPQPGRNGIGNIFKNLSAPIRVINSGFQGKFKESGREGSRFLLNSVFGVVGVFDVAKYQFGIEAPYSEDFGQTLGKYGVGEGPYLVLPFSGPSNLRDFLAGTLDRVIDPGSYLLPNNPWWLTGVNALETVHGISELMPRIDAMERDAIDPYLMLRDGFVQLRRVEVAR